MPGKEGIEFQKELSFDYKNSPTVIDVDQGEFAYSDFYPLHSAGYSTCVGVVVAATDHWGVALAHLDPNAEMKPDGKYFAASLDQMIAVVLSNGKSGKLQGSIMTPKATSSKFDVLFFGDGEGVVNKYGLVKYLETRYADSVRNIDDYTDRKGTKVGEIVVTGGAFRSARVLMVSRSSSVDFKSGKTAVLGSGDKAGVKISSKLGRARQIAFVESKGKESLIAEGGLT